MKRSANRTGKIWIGTSGWTYDGWRGPFYPKETPKRLWLSYYSTQFTTTEINGSFYRTPTLDAVRDWRDSTPREFTFAWKASKFITHWKRLSVKCENSIALMETRLEALGPKGCLVLFQLPPNFSADQARLAAFIQMLPNTRRYAFEFRHRSWYHDGIMELLQSRNAALCISDHGDAPSPWRRQPTMSTSADMVLAGASEFGGNSETARWPSVASPTRPTVTSHAPGALLVTPGR